MMGSMDEQSNETELTILKQINHPFKIKFIDEFEYQGKQCIVTEYISGGDLENFMKENLEISEEQILTFVTMLLLCL